MSAHVDILESRESLKAAALLSAVMHASLFTGAALYGWAGGRGHVQWGDPHSLGGGSVGINAVSQLPLPTRSGLTNPLATDTESRVPAPPKPLPQKAKPAERAEEPDAIAIRGRQRARRQAQAQSYRPQPERPNQLYSSSGQALSSNMFGAQTGTGGVGLGARSAFGYQYGWYRDLLEQRIAQKWRTGEIDPRLQSAPPVIVTFDILRDGSARNVRVLQSSGNRALDDSAQRAIFEASPFPPLPPQYERDSAQIEIWFQLKR